MSDITSPNSRQYPSPFTPVGFKSLQSVGFYKPSSFLENFKNEWTLSPQMDLWRSLVTRPDFEINDDWVINRRALDEENIRGYEPHYKDLMNTVSPEEFEYVKSVIDGKRVAREELEGTGSWAAALSVGILHPVNLVPIPWIRGAGFIRGFFRGGGAVGGLVTGEELIRQQVGIDVPLEESLMAIGSSFLIGGAFSGIVGSLTKKAAVDKLGDDLDLAHANYDRRSLSPEMKETLPDNNLPSPTIFDSNTNKVRINLGLIDQEKNARAWVDDPKYSMGEKKFDADEFVLNDDWMTFHFHRQNALINNLKREGEDGQRYIERINRLAYEGYNRQKFSGSMDMPMVSKDQTIPDNIFTVSKFSDVIRMNPVLRLLRKARQSFKGDSFIAQFGHIIADTGLMHDGAGRGFAKPQSVANLSARNWGWRAGEVIRTIDNEYQASLGFGRKDSDFTGVRVSAKMPTDRASKDEFFRRVLVSYITQGVDEKGLPIKIDDEFIDNSVRALNEQFGSFKEAGERFGIWGTNKKEFKDFGEKLDIRIEAMEKWLDSLKMTYFEMMDEKLRKMLELELKSRSGYSQGMTKNQHDLYLRLADEIEEMQRGAAFKMMDEHLSKMIKDIIDLKKTRIFVKQNEEGIWNQGRSIPDDVNYFPRFWDLENITKYRSIFINRITNYYINEPTARVWQERKGFVPVGEARIDTSGKVLRYETDMKTAEKRAEELFDRLVDEVGYGNADGGINPVGLGKGLRHFNQRQIDIPNSMLLDIDTPDGVIDFILLDQSIIRRYMDKTGPQIEMARMMGDRLGEGKILDVKQHINERFILPLTNEIKKILDAGPPSKSGNDKINSLQKKIDQLEVDKREVVEDILDIRDGVLLQFANIDPTRYSSRAVNLLKNFTSLAYMGSVIYSAMPDLARPLMVNGLTNYFSHIPQFALNPALVSKISKETREEIGEALEYSAMTTAKQYMEIGDGTFASKTTGIERFGHASQAPYYVANLLGPWTHMHKVFTSFLSGSLTVRYSKQLADNTLTKKGRIHLDMVGISDADAIRIANEMPVELSPTGNSYLLNLGAWQDKDLAARVGAGINREIQRTMVVPVTAGKPNIMSGVFPRQIGSIRIDKQMKAFAESDMGQRLGFSVIGDRVSNPWAVLPFQFLTWPIAATSSVLMEGVKRGVAHKDLSAWSGFMGMLTLGWFSGWMKTYDWFDLSFEEQAIRAYELSGVTGIFSDIPLMAEELTAGHLSLRKALGHNTLYERNIDDVVGRIGGAGPGMVFELTRALLDSGMKLDKRASAIRRATPFANLFYLKDVSFWAQRELVDAIED